MSTGYDTSSLLPGDAIAALRSYVRRSADLLRSADPAAVERLTARPLGDGRSTFDELRDFARELEQARRDLERIMALHRPTLSAVVLPVDPTDAHDAVAIIQEEAKRVADVAESVKGSDWNREGRRPDGTAVSALDVVREAVAAGSLHLRSIPERLEEATRLRD